MQGATQKTKQKTKQKGRRKAKLFINGRSQAVRLPKEFRFDGDEVNIERVGDGVMLTPVKKGHWEQFFNSLGKVTPDFMADGRNQGPQQERDFFE